MYFIFRPPFFIRNPYHCYHKARVNEVSYLTNFSHGILKVVIFLKGLYNHSLMKETGRNGGYQRFERNILSRVSPEVSHETAMDLLHFLETHKWGLPILDRLADKREKFQDNRLAVVLGNGMLELPNPLGVGAGSSTDGRGVGAYGLVGFSAVEVGQVTDKPEKGPEGHGLWLPKTGVSIQNRGGVNPGAAEVNRILQEALKLQEQGKKPAVGINIGVNTGTKAEDVQQSVANVVTQLYDRSDYFTFNIHSLAGLETGQVPSKKLLEDVFAAIQETMKEKGTLRPVFAKIGADYTLEELDHLSDIFIQKQIDGIVASDGTADPVVKGQYGSRWENVPGKLGGNNTNFRKKVEATIEHMYREYGENLDIIASGGIRDTKTALAYIQKGARMLQLNTAIREQGLAIPGRIARGLAEELDVLEKHEGRRVVLNELVGIDVPKAA